MPFKEIDLSKETASLRSILVLGVEKSGKTTFVGTGEKPILHYCFDSSSYKRLAGQVGITSVLVEGGNVVSEFEREMTSLLITPKKYTWPDGRVETYKTIAFDPISFHSDAILEDSEARISDGFKVYGAVLKSHSTFLDQVKKLTKVYDVIVTSHVEIRQDDTTGKKMLLADMNGKIRNSIGAHFNGVAFTKVVPKPGGRAEYWISFSPDDARKAGVTVPMGCEEMFGQLEKPDFQALKAKYNAALEKVKAEQVTITQPSK